MRSQLDETIRAKQQITADSKVRQDQPAKFLQQHPVLPANAGAQKKSATEPSGRWDWP